MFVAIAASRGCSAYLRQTTGLLQVQHILYPHTKRFTTAQTKSQKDERPAKQIIVVTSGKGGVGKTTTAASFSFGLAQKGYKTCVIDFDIGLRNLDIHFGMERRIIFDFINVINQDCSVKQALVQDKRCANLFLLAASQTRDKTALREDGVERVLDQLRREFDYIVCDSPAGIESGAHHAMFWADDAIVCTNPEMSSVRDSDKMIGIIASKSKRAVQGRDPPTVHVLITRYNPDRVQDNNMLSVKDILDTLGVTNTHLVGVVPESPDILKCTNLGRPVITLPTAESDAAAAYEDSVARFLGEERPMRFVDPKPKSLLHNFMRKFVS